jgi:hypothetical protein
VTYRTFAEVNTAMAAPPNRCLRRSLKPKPPCRYLDRPRVIFGWIVRRACR